MIFIIAYNVKGFAFGGEFEKSPARNKSRYKLLKLRTYFIAEIPWVEPELKLSVVTKADGSTPSAPLTQSRMLPAVFLQLVLVA
jgi:hypothetical protein